MTKITSLNNNVGLCSVIEVLCKVTRCLKIEFFLMGKERVLSTECFQAKTYIFSKCTCYVSDYKM